MGLRYFKVIVQWARDPDQVYIPSDSSVFRGFSWPIQFSHEVTAITCAGNNGLRVIVNVGWSTIGFTFRYLNTYTQGQQDARGAIISVGW